jgi:hypothetical protein
VTGEKASIYDTTAEPGGVLRIPCGNRHLRLRMAGHWP